MGWLYSSGTWVAQNKTEAIFWYKKAAGKGDFEAQLALGWMYYAGVGVTADRREAAAYYRKAAGQGSDKAVVMLMNLELAPEAAADVKL